MNGYRNGRERGALDRRGFLRGLGGAGLATAAAARAGWAQGKPAAIVVAIQGGDDGRWTKQFLDPLFEKRYGVSVRQLIGTHPDRLVKLRAEVPNASFHVYFSKADFVTQAIDMNLLEPLSESLVPGYAKVPDKLKTAHSVSSHYNAEGILFNPKVVDRPTAWSVLWDPKYRGKVALNRFVDRMLMIAALYATGGKDLRDEERAWKAIEQLVRDQKGKYVASSEQLGTLFERGEIVVASYWHARALQWKAAGVPMDFAFPREGAVAESWAYGIPRGTASPFREYAGKWIGLRLEEETGVSFAQAMAYPSASLAVKYPPEIARTVLTKQEFDGLAHPDYRWITKNIGAWTERYNKLLTQ